MPKIWEFQNLKALGWLVFYPSPQRLVEWYLARFPTWNSSTGSTCTNFRYFPLDWALSCVLCSKTMQDLWVMLWYLDFLTDVLWAKWRWLRLMWSDAISFLKQWETCLELWRYHWVLDLHLQVISCVKDGEYAPNPPPPCWLDAK